MVEDGYNFYQKELPHLYMSENGLHDLPPKAVSDAELPLGPLHNPAIPGILRENDAPEAAIGRVFNHRGEMIYTTEDDIDFRDPSLQLFTAEAELFERTAPVYALADYRLRGDKRPHGYSHHDLEHHVVPVAKMALEILQMGKFPKHTQMLALMAAYGHDLGNVNRRKGHSFDSPDIYAHIVPSVTRNEQDWRTVSRAIWLHDEKAMLAEVEKWGPLSIGAKVQKIHEMGEGEGLPELPAVLSALILADKADIDRDRINPWAINHEAVADDEHVWVNLCAENKGLLLSDDGKELILRINFDQFVNLEEQDKFSPVMRRSIRHDRLRIHVPEKVHRAHRDSSSKYFDEWVTSLNNIYHERMDLMAVMAFVALPIDFFKIELRDPDGGTVRTQLYTPALMDKRIEELARDAASKEEGKKEFESLYERNGIPPSPRRDASEN